MLFSLYFDGSLNAVYCVLWTKACISCVRWIHPEHGVDVDAAFWTRILQIKPLIQIQILTREKTGNRNGQTSQNLNTVIILHLKEMETVVSNMNVN